MMVAMTDLLPKLVVSRADDAIAFYTTALGAALKDRHVDPEGIVVHAELDFDDHRFALAEAVPDWGWLDPRSLGGSPVLLTIVTGDPDATAHRMIHQGATVVVPIDDRPYGKREGRLQDPFGHLWIISGDLMRS